MKIYSKGIIRNVFKHQYMLSVHDREPLWAGFGFYLVDADCTYVTQVYIQNMFMSIKSTDVLRIIIDNTTDTENSQLIEYENRE